MITRPLDREQYRRLIDEVAAESDFTDAWEGSDLNTPEGRTLTVRYSDHIGTYMDMIVEEVPVVTDTELWEHYEPAMVFYANWIDANITRLGSNYDTARSKLGSVVS